MQKKVSMQRLFYVLPFLLCSLWVDAQQPVIFDGKVKCEILVSPQADSSELKAAHEMQRYLWRITGMADTDVAAGQFGGTVKVREEQRLGEGLPAIYIGHTAYATRHYSKQLAALRSDGFLVASDGRDLCVCGNTAKGTLYGVYDFLEQHLGCRYLTPEAEWVPVRGEYLLDSFVEVKNPAFDYREVLYYYPNQSQLFADKHKLHNRADLMREWGMFVHTFQHLVPANRYFDSHPEWFSEIGGRRVRDGQLCLSNPQVLETLCDNLDSLMREHPDKRIWSVSNNDNYNNCSCAACRRADSVYGGPSGTLIHFINQVARRFPDKTISTLGYQYTRRPPRQDCAEPQRPDSNVNIMFCSIECGREEPITTASGEQSFRNDMEGWNAITDNIFMWDYVVQFRNFWNPFPNLHVLQPNLQYFRDHGVRMMFEQGTGAANKTSWMELRTYLIAKLMWNPDIDADSLLHDFCEHYYRSASPYVEQIMAEMMRTLLESGQRLDIYGYAIDGSEGYLKHLPHYQLLMDSAFAAVASHQGDRVVTPRLEYFALSLDYAALELAMNNVAGMSFFKVQNDERVVDSVMVRRADRFVEGCHRFGVRYLHEMGYTPDEYRADIDNYLRKCAPGALSKGKKVELRNAEDSRYAVNGAQSLTDGVSGILDYRHNWLGFYGKDFDAVVDMDEEVSEISIDFFFFPLSWIFAPVKVLFYVSDDARHWEEVGCVEGNNPQLLANPAIETFCCKLERKRRVGYVRIVAKALPAIPDWHRAAGNPVWLFTDEIVVR